MATDLIFIFTCSIFGFSIGNDNLLAEIESGVQISGFMMTTVKNRSFVAFHGIPYAEPPEGELRFKPPVAKIWTEKTFNATEYGYSCMQMEKNADLISEDCLVLNVYSHNISKPLRKVMVFIHGGSFKEGSGSDYGPRRLLDRDLVLVTINYRLGVFGFLATMDESSPGNYGLLDQTEALKWVQKNIAAFGGDPKKVTIFGQSAGSMSILSHILSPVSAGLFHRAIAQSGNLFQKFEQKNPLYWTNMLANSVDCVFPTTMETIKCLRHVPANTLIEAAGILEMVPDETVFVPVSDGYFFTDLPSKLLRRGEIFNTVPILFGFTKDEELVYSLELTKTFSQVSTKLIVTLIGGLLNRQPYTVPIEAMKLVRKRYFDSDKLINNTELLQSVINKAGTDSVLTSCYETVQVLLNYGIKPFIYSFDYATNHSFINYLFDLNDTLGDTHGDDLFFLFDFPSYSKDLHREMNDETEETFLNIWTSFAETGIPTEEVANGKVYWKPSVKEQMKIYHLNTEITIEDYQPDKDWRYKFWLETIPPLLNYTINEI